MMSLPPTKKTAPKEGCIIPDRHVGKSHSIAAAVMTLHGQLQVLPPKPVAPKPVALKPVAPKPVAGNGDLPPTTVGRLVSVEEAAFYARVGRTKMYELIDVGAVRSGLRPGSNRRWVDLDSIDELYRSPERMREAKELIRRLRAKKMMAKNARENDIG